MPNPTDDATPTAPATATCACCSTLETDGGSSASGDRWLGDEAPLETDLPEDLATGFGRVLGEPPMATLAEWLATVRERAGDGAIDVEALCHADGPTPHVGRVGDETYHFQCFYDTVVLSSLVDEPVAITTESPGGTTIEADAVGTRALDVTPETAVFSVGADADVTPPADGHPAPSELYGAVCPYVRAFPDRAAYASWAGAVSAATAGLPLDGATEFAAVLVE